jgi:hypothetical protein
MDVGHSRATRRSSMGEAASRDWMRSWSLSATERPMTPALAVRRQQGQMRDIEDM